LARKILLADDSVTAQNMGRKILADAGYEVITVNNGSAALKKIAELKPDLIVLDVYMPGYSGLEVCQRLKEAQETSRVPVLLTVGKLEPFKPEEAKRVRADGFIVKPFEASELLSALSKLEDKIVPRSESSKPGRFARATAAIEDSRFDKTVAIDEDSGWRNRIAFPPKKKEKASEEDGDDSAIYNAMNKDLRTVVESKPADTPHPTKSEETKVDLGALAPEGLPKDVTPEEIAALAAAAAQVKGNIAEGAPGADTKTEPSAKAAQDAQPVVEAPQEVAAPVATFAEQKSEEKIEAASEKASEAPKEVASVTPSPADVMAAISALESESGASQGTSAGNESWLHHATSQTADEPVTMAVAAGASSTAVTSRWKAVSVALAPEEGTISLELEMQKAHAAFAAGDAVFARHTAATPEPQNVSVGLAPAIEVSSPAEASVQESAGIVPLVPTQEAVETISAVAGAPTGAIGTAVQEPEVVAAHVEPITPAPPEPETAPSEKSEAASSPATEAPQTVSEKSTTEITAENPVAAADPEIPKLEAVQPDVPQTGHEESIPGKIEEPKSEGPAPVVSAAAAESEEASSKNAETLDRPSASVNAVPAEQVPERNSSDTANGESDASDKTAAAWASWHRVRESGAPSAEPGKKEAENKTATAEDGAARAVAAGAEKAPEDASATHESEAEGIASIVDSVLAEMRPKIYEEISRKMGKKK
jgi:two-component system, chemotaxis family, chemotaxis protein CheY